MAYLLFRGDSLACYDEQLYLAMFETEEQALSNWHKFIQDEDYVKMLKRYSKRDTPDAGIAETAERFKAKECWDKLTDEILKKEIVGMALTGFGVYEYDELSRLEDCPIVHFDPGYYILHVDFYHEIGSLTKCAY